MVCCCKRLPTRTDSHHVIWLSLLTLLVRNRSMKLYCVIILYVLIRCAYCQYLKNDKSSRPSCETPNKAAALVESFFSVVFSNFQSTPPICVCVQMCPDQPSYCYPNTCLKKTETVKSDFHSTIKIDEVNIPNYFGDLINDFAEKSYINEMSLAEPGAEPQYKNNNIERLDPLLGNYKSLFDFKRFSKADGFRRKPNKSKVKNINADLVKSENKINRNLKDNIEDSLPVSNSKFFISMLSDKNVNIPSRYFKRELIANDTLVDKDGNITNSDKQIYLIETSALKNDTINTVFRDLIEDDNFAVDTIADLIIETDVDKTNFIKRAINDRKNTMQAYNETTDVISLNLSNENVDKNIYKENNALENLTDTYNTLIEKLSKNIEVQNNKSLEMIMREPVDYDYEKDNAKGNKFIMMLIPNTSRDVVILDVEKTPTKQQRIARRRMLRNN